MKKVSHETSSGVHYVLRCKRAEIIERNLSIDDYAEAAEWIMCRHPSVELVIAYSDPGAEDV